MLVLPGAPALSEFRLQKLRSDLSGILPELEIVTRFIHFVDLEDALDDDELTVINRILTYGPTTSSMPDINEVPGVFRLVVPRTGTISPWSSKATDILKICGLAKVRRIERGIAWRLNSDSPLSIEQMAIADACIHDRMTESVLSTMDASILFAEADPQTPGAIPLLPAGIEVLKKANQKMGMALTRDEMIYLVDAFTELGRDPTDTELMMFAQANSEHCRHKTFNARWTIDGVPQRYSLMEMIQNSHRQINGYKVLSAYQDNASVIEGNTGKRFYPDPVTREYGYAVEDVHILMKVETHNHPTAIAPFPGAATGAGGEIRDEGAVGRGSKPKAGLTGYSVSNLLIPGAEESWEVDYGKPDHISSALDIMIQAPIGGAAFNNEFGRPNICGYFRSYELQAGGEIRGYHKPIMIAGGLGNIRQEHISMQNISVGASLIVLGGPAMLIGLGGGAASSMASGASDADLDFASVQRGNPEIQHRCQEVIDQCWQLGEDNPIQFIHDVGAGGLSNALPELVHDGGVGGWMELRSIPSDEPGMTPMEIWCNEAQERYVLAVAGDDLERFTQICARERCPFAVVGKAVNDTHLTVTDDFFADKPVDLPMSVLFGKSPSMHRDAQTRTLAGSSSSMPDLETAIQRVIGHPTVASKSFLITIGDRTVGGQVARDQMVGPWQTPVADVAVTSTDYHSITGEAMSMGERAPIALLDAPASGRMAVAESICNMAAALTGQIENIKLSANWMAAVDHPGEDAKLYKTVETIGLNLCPQLGICIPVGKDSTSMQTRWQQPDGDKAVTAPLSLIISAFAPVLDVRDTLTPELRRDADSVLLYIDLAVGRQRLGGSVLLQCQNETGIEAPDVEDVGQLKAFFEILQQRDLRQRIWAYHDRSDGGLFTTLVEMAFAARCGLDIILPSEIEPVAFLFNEELGAVLQVARQDAAMITSRFAARGISARVMATPTDNGDISIFQEDNLLYRQKRSALQARWSETSHRIQTLRDNPQCAKEEFAGISDEDDPGLSVHLTWDINEDVAAPVIATGVKPGIAILREQGVNSQVEMAAAFTRAGFSAIDVHMSEILSGDRDLSTFRGMVACGGFSYGDVLGAGEGWAKSILFHSRVRDIFAAFFERSDTFGLGVCNGCQMMASIKELIPGAENWPRFVTNRSEQFEARFSLVQVLDSPSILFSGMSGSHMPIAVSHGEGRADISATDAARLVDAGLVPLHFVDHYLSMTETYPMNPNGSPMGITAVTTIDGRFTAMMPHPERVYRTIQNSWHPDEWQEDSPWMRLFRNARRHC